MVLNPEKNKMLIRQKIDDLFNKGLLKMKQGIEYKALVRSFITAYPVSEFFIEKYIDKYYVSEGTIILKDGILHHPSNLENKEE
jgi:hypothetical protein